MLYTLAIIIVIILVIVFRHISGLPQVHRVTQGELFKFVEVLLLRGFDGGYMIIEGSRKNLFLQFKKYITQKNVYLEFSFPNAQWSSRYYGRLAQYLEDNGIYYETSKIDKASPLEFINVDCGTDAVFCAKLVREIFINIFDYEEAQLVYRVKYTDVSPKDERIGF